MGSLLSRPANWIYDERTCDSVGHTKSSSCIYSAGEMFLFIFTEAFKMYLPLFLISDIIRRKHPRKILTSTLPSVVLSSIFLGINGGGFVAFICIFRRLFGRFYFLTTAYLPSLCASFLAIITEKKSRRRSLTAYVGTIAIESLYRMAKYRGYIQPLPYGEVLMFCLASAVLLYDFRSSTKSDAISSILSILFKPRLPKSFQLTIPGRYQLLQTTVSFLTEIALVTLWSFTLGYALQAILNAIQLGNRIIRNPARIKQVLSKPYNRQFGAFLATLTSFFKILNTVLFILAVPRDIRLLIAGFFAGLSMFFIRSNTISLYAAVKALEILFFKAVKKGWLRSYYYGDVILYSIFTATIFHAVMFEGHNIRLSYWRFIAKITKNRIYDVNFEAVDIFQTDASQLIRMLRAQQQIESRQQEQKEQQQKEQQQQQI